MSHKFYILYVIVTHFVLCNVVVSASNYPLEIEAALKKSGVNRKELEKVIHHYSRAKKDSLKLKATFFIISNMDIHFSSNYYWADNANQKIEFDDRSYLDDYDKLNLVFDSLSKQIQGIHPVFEKISDIETITSECLISNIDIAFSVWLKSNTRISFKLFCEYILPYRIVNEPLFDWRQNYDNIFNNLYSVNNDVSETFLKLKQNIVILNVPQQRIAVEPRFTPSVQCHNLAVIGAKAFRSCGVPCAFDMVTAWATTEGRHYWNTLLYNDTIPEFPFDPSAQSLEKFTLKREPAKVLRFMYSKQATALGCIIPEKDIPECVLKFKNYVDVTERYWPVTDVKCKVNALDGVVYACVWNSGDWEPCYWGCVYNDSTIFCKMGKGAVYLPMSYSNKILKPTGYPVAVGFNNSLLLKPDYSLRRTVLINEQAKYLILRPQKLYTLYMWDYSWVKVGSQVASEQSNVLVFDNVPSNTLLLLIPEYSKGKERPFIYTNDQKRIWF